MLVDNTRKFGGSQKAVGGGQEEGLKPILLVVTVFIILSLKFSPDSILLYSAPTSIHLFLNISKSLGFDSAVKTFEPLLIIPDLSLAIFSKVSPRILV